MKKVETTDMSKQRKTPDLSSHGASKAVDEKNTVQKVKQVCDCRSRNEKQGRILLNYLLFNLMMLIQAKICISFTLCSCNTLGAQMDR